MRVAIDARMIRPGNMHGIARYVYELLTEINSLPTPGLVFSILVNEGSPLYQKKFREGIELYHIKAGWIGLREQFELPRALKRIRADLFHAPSFAAPLFCPCRLVMTIHDLNHVVLPQYYTPLHQFYYQFFVRSCIKKSETVLTVSQFSKSEIVKNLQLGEKKIFVTYNGISKRYKPEKDTVVLQYVQEMYELPDKFIFCLSNNKPHKNVQQLVRAYCHSQLNIPLVLACEVDRDLIALAEKYGKKHQLYFSKFIAEEHLPAVYSLTDLFVYPSTYEGFGLPPLEALACGAPVVVARSSSLPEVVGDCAIFADPYDYRDIARALEQGIKEKTVSVDASVGHASKFSWRQMAMQTIDIYRKSVKLPKNAAARVLA